MNKHARVELALRAARGALRANSTGPEGQLNESEASTRSELRKVVR